MTSTFRELLRNSWLAMFSIKFFMLLLGFHITCLTADDTVKIAAILDMNTLEGREAKLSLKLAVQDVNEGTHLTINGSRLSLHLQEYDGNVGSVLQVFREEVVAIVVQDPKISKFLESIAEAVQVPILSLSGDSGTDGSAGRPRYVVSALSNHSDSDDMQVVTVIVENFQWKQVIVIYEEEKYWLTGVYVLNKALEQHQRTRIFQSAGVSSFSDWDDIKNTLLQLNKSHVKAYILYTSADVGLKIFSLATELGMMKEPYAWVVTDSIASSIDSFNDSSIKTMQGIVGIRRVITLTPQIMEFQTRLQLSSSETSSKGIWLQVYSCIILISKAVANLVSEGGRALQFEDIESPENNREFVTSVKVLRGGDSLLKQINSLKSGGLTDYIGLWAIAGAYFVLTAFLVWLMEPHNSQDFKGGIIQQTITSLTAELITCSHKHDQSHNKQYPGGLHEWLICQAASYAWPQHICSKTGTTTEKLMSGEVGAIVDVSAYIDEVRTMYPCPKFTIVDQGYFATGGFGYLFKKGSPFLEDISKAVLHMSEKKMVQSISSEWFGKRS